MKNTNWLFGGKFSLNLFFSFIILLIVVFFWASSLYFLLVFLSPILFFTGYLFLWLTRKKNWKFNHNLGHFLWALLSIIISISAIDFYSQETLTIESSKVETNTLRAIAGIQGRFNVTGNIRNSSRRTCSNITLKIRYYNEHKQVMRSELLSLHGLAVPPNSLVPFDVDTKNAPKYSKIEYSLLIDSFSK